MQEPLKIFKNVSVKSISPDDNMHYFFGYYDLCPFDKTGRYHLAHRVSFFDRLPEKDDICEIGLIDTENNTFKKLGETTAWNFQQGALLNWYGDDAVIYNVRTEKGYGAVIKYLNGAEKEIPMPLATSSAVSKKGISINFNRIFDFRPGYGYAGIPDEFADVKAPAEDGVFTVDLETGESHLIISYKDLIEQFPEEPYASAKLLVNHLNLNPKGDRFVMLLRNFLIEGYTWKTMLIASDLEGNMVPLTNYRFNSHYCWKNDRELLIVSDNEDKKGCWLFDTYTGEAEFINMPGLDGRDIHCLYSPDQKYIIGDAYPEQDYPYRNLMVYDCEKGTFEPMLASLSTADANWDIRADLHARFDRTGNQISFDATHNNKREICVIDMKNF